MSQLCYNCEQVLGELGKYQMNILLGYFNNIFWEKLLNV